MINSEWNDFWNSGKIDDYLKFKQTENQYYGINWEVRNGKENSSLRGVSPAAQRRVETFTSAGRRRADLTAFCQPAITYTD